MGPRNSNAFAAVLVIVAALLSIGAGIYLFQTESASDDPTIFDALFKGLGGYMVARGLYMVATLIPIEKEGV